MPLDWVLIWSALPAFGTLFRLIVCQLQLPEPFAIATWPLEPVLPLLCCNSVILAASSVNKLELGL